MSNPDPGENLASGNLVMETECTQGSTGSIFQTPGSTTTNRIAIITTTNRIAIITTTNRIAIITTTNRIAITTTTTNIIAIITTTNI